MLCNVNFEETSEKMSYYMMDYTSAIALCHNWSLFEDEEMDIELFQTKNRL